MQSSGARRGKAKAEHDAENETGQKMARVEPKPKPLFGVQGLLNSPIFLCGKTRRKLLDAIDATEVALRIFKGSGGHFHDAQPEREFERVLLLKAHLEPVRRVMTVPTDKVAMPEGFFQLGSFTPLNPEVDFTSASCWEYDLDLAVTRVEALLRHVNVDPMRGDALTLYTLDGSKYDLTNRDDYSHRREVYGWFLHMFKLMLTLHEQLWAKMFKAKLHDEYRARALTRLAAGLPPVATTFASSSDDV